MTASAITQRVTRAERDGLVVRSAGAVRAVLVELTTAGHELVESVVADVRARDGQQVFLFDDAELAQLEEMLLRWRDALRRS